MATTPATPTDPQAGTDEVDRALKSAHAAMWALGDYPSIAEQITLPLAPVLVDACGVTAGQRVLDVASGTGNAALEAARRGAAATASDLTAHLLEAGRGHQPDAVRWIEADAENLPFGDGEFDVVMSAIGVMFTPHHERSSSEMARVCRSGGTVGVLSWTPSGFIGQMFATMKPYAAPPPPGSSPAPLWGDPDHVAQLFGDRVRLLDAQERSLPIRLFDGPSSFRSTSRPTTGRPSPCTAGSVTTKPQSRRSTRTSTTCMRVTRYRTGRPSGTTWSGRAPGPDRASSPTFDPRIRASDARTLRIGGVMTDWLVANVRDAHDRGVRVLVDRLWPRGVSKQAAALDEWAKDVAPSTELRKWFHHGDGVGDFAGFKTRYEAELDANDVMDGFITAHAADETVVLLTSTGDREHNGAVVLRAWLEAHS